MASAFVTYVKGVYHLDTYCIASIRRQRKTFTDLGELAVYLHRLATGNDVPQSDSPTVIAVLDAYIDYATRVKKAAPAYIRRMNTAKIALSSLYRVTVDTLNKNRFDSYVQDRLNTVKPSTVKAEYVLLHAALEHALSRDAIERNPLANYWKGIKPQHVVNEVPSIQQIATIFNALPDTDTQKAIYFLLATGCRVNDLITLRASDVVRNNGTMSVRFRHAKFSRERVVEIPALPFELPASGHAFCYHGRPWRAENLLRKLQHTCMQVHAPVINVHDLRRSHATYSLASGESQYSVMARCGWKSLAMVQRYVQIAPQYRHEGQWLPVFSESRA